MGDDGLLGARTRFGTPAPLRTPVPGKTTQPSAIIPAVTLAPGMRVHQYELIRELGRGGMGVVFAARDTKLGRRVAIKFVPEAARQLAERFLIEAQATAQCTHDNIVIIHAVDEHRGVPYMVLEFLEGQTLRQLAEAVHQLPASRLIEIMLPVARALARAHELGVVHRDLKLENVIVTHAGHVKVLDFGIATALGGAIRLTQESLPESGLVGTLAYMSPEQMTGEPVDFRSDVWAAGIMMWELLAGDHPVEPATVEALFQNASSEAPMRPIADVVPDIPEALAVIVDSCLRKRRDERPTSDEVVRTLEQLLPDRAGRTLAIGESPYPGLMSFQESDANRFYGRDREIARVVARIRAQPLTGVVGPSGSGKSSFVRAGIGPALKASGERWEILAVRPGRNPLGALGNLVHGATASDGGEVLVDRLGHEPGRLGELLRRRAKLNGGHILVFVDQLEELYTLVPDAAIRHAFIAALEGIADDASAPLRVVVSMRSDFLDRVSEDPRFADELSRGLAFLATPDREGLRDALVHPIELVGYKFESAALVDEMLGALGSTPGSLPLLQFAASKLWDARDRNHRVLTAASYAAIGGISGALATHADEVVAAMNPAGQKLTQRIFRALVTPERTRAVVELTDLQELASDGGELVRVIDQLVAARLLVVQTRGDAGGGAVEIVHESLIERWPALRRWLDDAQEDAAYLAQLAGAAKQWDGKRRPAGLLWRGDAIDEARRWLASRPRELPARERAFLDAAFALARRGARAKLAAVIGGFALLGAIAAGAIASRASIASAKDEAMASAERATRAAHTAETALAEAQAKEQARIAAERERAAAETARATAESLAEASAAQAKEANTEVVHSREELEAQNTKLKAAAREAEVAKQRALQSAAEAEKAKGLLQRSLDTETARVKKLEDERKSISTQLKE